MEMSASSRQPVGEVFTGSLAGEAADSWSSAWAKARVWASGGGETCHQLACIKGTAPLRPLPTSALVATETETQQV